MELDDWNFSVEELDYLEKDAYRKIAERVSSSQDSLHKKAEPSSPSPAKALPASQSGVKEMPLRKLSVKLFLHATGNIAAKFQYSTILVDAIRNVPKATWHSKERLWMFPMSSLSSAEKILSEVKGTTVEVEKLDRLVRSAIAAASSVQDLRDLYDRMPSFIESKLLPFQRDGVRFVLQHGGRVLIADEMGLGKTLQARVFKEYILDFNMFQAIAVTACIRDSWPVLVLTPSSLRLQWATMIQQWLNIPSTDILVVLSQCSGSNRGGFTIVHSNAKSTIHLDGVFNIISYDSVPKLEQLLMASEFKKAKYVILLSGTPALSRPIELFKQLEALYPDVYKNSFHEYGNRFCKGGIFGEYQGASNHEELHNLMKATVMIRRLKKDVLSELPVKRRQQVFLEVADKDMKQINALFRELDLVKIKIKDCESKEDLDSHKFSEKNLINKIYNDSADAKIPAVKDYLETVIEAGCKFLIFAHHKAMIDSIHQFLLKKKVGCIRIDGGTPASSRQALVTDFQDKEGIKAAVLSIKAGGIGLTLTAASTVIFAELSWTPGDIIQAEDRVHRIGQVSSVNIYYLLANYTIDDIIWDAVQNKLENLGQMLDGHENALEVSVSQLKSSPAKQRTLDSFMKRCQSSTNDELDNSTCDRPIKYPRN
ncbi:hypothetical protein IFM89_005004 [Coptis chinensis]|uniref:SWI/SNF-related matrix-associated actin-dependent regulator of chromatin subfamily A-like protein 1 n=1 Tax=Coptis chinensis TaxID=261450 RepID=A0A835HJ10_9MAGN|nr:hypothetical protein IFM89_005004 [Coptis chinensis]